MSVTNDGKIVEIPPTPEDTDITVMSVLGDGKVAAVPLSPDDTVIAVIGVTGVGKSSFIAHFSDSAKVGHGLTSCTEEIGVHEAFIGKGKQRVILIDTPGFDDTNKSDTDILCAIADWLNESYKNNIKLSGIVYLQRISDPRVGGSSLKNMIMFKKLCGTNSLSSVVLATTMWSQVDQVDGERRETELKSNPDFWQRMVEKGSMVMRHDRGKLSALEIIQQISSDKSRRMVLDIQKEMADGKTQLNETSAGKVVEAELNKIREIHEKQILEIQQDMLKAQKEKDLKSQKELEEVRAELQKTLHQAREDRQNMRVNREQLHDEGVRELRAEWLRTQALLVEQQKEIAKKDSEMRILEATNKHDLEMLAKEHLIEKMKGNAKRMKARKWYKFGFGNNGEEEIETPATDPSS